MKLVIERKWCNPDCTIGLMTVNGMNEYFTLEDQIRPDPNPETPVNEAKVMHETAIPKGSYNVLITKSKRFGYETPILENVPGFEGIRIHRGNTAADSSGCILVGRHKGPNWVSESRAAFNDIYRDIKAAIDRGEQVILEIV